MLPTPATSVRPRTASLSAVAGLVVALTALTGCAGAEEPPDTTAQVCRQAAVVDASLAGVHQAVGNGSALPSTTASTYAAGIERLTEAVAEPGELDTAVEEALLELVGGYSRLLAELTAPVPDGVSPRAVLDDLSPLLNAEQRLAEQLQQACAD